MSVNHRKCNIILSNIKSLGRYRRAFGALMTMRNLAVTQTYLLLVLRRNHRCRHRHSNVENRPPVKYRSRRQAPIVGRLSGGLRYFMSHYKWHRVSEHHHRRHTPPEMLTSSALTEALIIASIRQARERHYYWHRSSFDLLMLKPSSWKANNLMVSALISYHFMVFTPSKKCHSAAHKIAS